MSFIRKEAGEQKADWLWRRMDILCTRTVLSILPILSTSISGRSTGC
jgi:hypothetical protein